MEIKRFEFNLFGECTYVIWNTHTRQGAVIDPGMASKNESLEFQRFISDHDIDLRYALMTHLHIDHTFGLDTVKELYGVTVVAHKADQPLGANREVQAAQFHLPYKLGPVVIDRFVKDGDELRLGDERIEVLECPGHSPGSLLFYIPHEGCVFTGDAVFRGSIGRTDLPGGNYAQLIRSIHTKIITLPTSTVIYPGHGPETTVGEEIRTNPYF